jgi:hypothetical protein
VWWWQCFRTDDDPGTNPLISGGHWQHAMTNNRLRFLLTYNTWSKGGAGATV